VQHIPRLLSDLLRRATTADTDDVGRPDTGTRNGKPSPVATSKELELELEGLEFTNRRSSMDEIASLKLHNGFKPMVMMMGTEVGEYRIFPPLLWYCPLRQGERMDRGDRQ